MLRYPAASSPFLRLLLLIGLTVIAAATFFDRAYAGAWTAPKGASYNKFALNYFKSDKSFDTSGDLIAYTNNGTSRISEFRDTNISYYGEYGLRDDLTVFGDTAFKHLESDQSTGTLTNSGIGDIDVGVRYNFYNGPNGVFSTQGLIKLPNAYNKNDSVPLGNGQNDYELRFLYGNSSLYPLYYGVEMGYRWRVGDPSDEWKYLFEVGYTINPKFYVRTKLDGTYSAQNGATGLDISGNPTLTNNYDLGKAEFTVGYTISKLLMLEGTWTPTPYGKNTAYGNTFQIAIIYAPAPTKSNPEK
jgi:hypothetical protein